MQPGRLIRPAPKPVSPRTAADGQDGRAPGRSGTVAPNALSYRENFRNRLDQVPVTVPAEEIGRARLSF